MSTDAALTQILAQLQALQTSQQTMQAQLDNMAASKRPMSTSPPETPERRGIPIPSVSSSPTASTGPSIAESSVGSFATNASSTTTAQTDKERERTLYPGRVNLTTYPDQHGIKPHQMVWGAPDAATRGAVICSRLPGSIKVRNALGAHSGSYSIYRALSIAMGSLSPSHKPDYNMTDPPIEIPFSTQWKNVVSFDPWGHLVPSVFRSDLDAGLDARPSIAITRAHIKLSEIDESHRRGDIEVDGTVVHKSRPLKDENGKEVDYDPGVEISVGKAAIEPVWFLPGVAERFQISESLLRRALFEETGGMYPELITRPDIKVFLPPIGGQTVYIFGPQEYLNDESKTLTLRVHDECNGSDVFGSDICTCKPYLIYAIEECIRTAQKGGVGVVVYFRKEGRALGEVTKYLVYNLRKRGGDSADRYFKSTEMIAGVKDMRFQALMPDTLHWLGIKKIDNMVSMSDMKYDAIVGSGIPILKRYDLPEHLIPPDSRVEIDAKIAAGYFSSSKTVTEADLVKTVGRTWEETEH